MRAFRTFLAALLALSLGGQAPTQTVSPNSVATALAPAPVAAGLQAIPSSTFSWAPPIYRGADARYYADFDPRSLLPSSLYTASTKTWAGSVYYADAAAANNASSGTTATTPKRGIYNAWSTCEATAATACVVFVKGCATGTAVAGCGLYDRANDLNNTGGGTTAPNKPLAVICWGGQCVTGPIVLGLTWALDGTYTASYTASRSLVYRVLNLLATDTFGDPVECSLLASASAVNTATLTGSSCVWYQASAATPVYVRRADGAAPSDTNSRVLLGGVGVTPGAADFYMSGFTVQGGSVGSFAATNAGTRNIVIEDSRFSFPGWYGGGGTSNSFTNAIRVDNMTGTAVFARTVASKGLADLYNFHQTTGNLNVLLMDAIGYDTGLQGNSAVSGATSLSNSNNDLTCHDLYLKIIDLNGRYSYGAGGAIHNIGNCSMWALGTKVSVDRGDIALGGGVPSACILIDGGGTAEAWLQEVSVDGCLTSLGVGPTNTIHVRNVTEKGGSRSITSGGAITNY